MRKALYLLLCIVIAYVASFQPVAAASSSTTRAAEVEETLLGLPESLGPGCWSRLEKITYLKGQMSKLQPVHVKYDHSLLREQDKKVLEGLIKASKFIDLIFLRQVSEKNMALRNRLESSKDPLDQLLLRYFIFNFGPFDRLNNYHVFYGNEEARPGAAFYPPDMTRQEFESWLSKHPEDRDLFMSDFTVIRRKGQALVAVPYSQEYADLLEPAAGALMEAAEHCDNESLRKFLQLRARAFGTNDYYQSDLAWMDIEGSTLEMVIGPYEVYEDRLMNYKAAFESFVVLNLPGEARKFQEYARYLRDMEANLPLEERYKDLTRDFSSPIRIVHEIFSAGDGKAGIHTSAFALPNDERVRNERGCKKIMLKNIMEAKFKGSTFPIAQRIIAAEQLPSLSFEAYFRDTVFHELSHGLGPGLIKLSDGNTRDARMCLKENYSSIEECKADTLSVYNQIFLMEKGVIPRKEYRNLCVSYLAGIFRSVRFGMQESHGRGSLVQFNWLMDRGAIAFSDAKGTYQVNFDRFDDGIKSLARELLEIQAQGDYERSVRFLERYGKCPPHLALSLSRLYEIPVDIEPLYENEK
jgi:hypothetical protein